jgi:ABC-type antimicrobial peptide transport system permease subunit
MLTGRFLEILVEGAKSIDLTALIISILFIILIASASIWTGTRHISQLDILEVLRIE